MRMRTTNNSSSWIKEGESLVLRTSLLKTYLRCPAQCFFRYFKGLIIRPPSWITLGSCTHVAAEKANKYKLKKGRDEKLSNMQDVFYEEWSKRKKETIFSKGEDPNSIESEGIKKIVPTFHSKIHTKIEPKHVEEPFKVDFEEGNFSVTGTLDLIEQDDMIRDLKTKRRAPRWDEASKSFQGKSYIYGFRKKFNRNPEGFMLDCIIRKKDPEVISTRPVAPSKLGYTEFRDTCIQIVRSIRDGIFYPRREGNMFCSKEFCGYWDICHKGKWKDVGIYTSVYNKNREEK